MVPRIKEERAIILDFLPNGYPFDKRPLHMKTPIAQALGKEHFILLELVPKKEVFLQLNEEVYMGEGKREKIHHIAGRIPFDKLTQTAKLGVETLIRDMVTQNELKFVEFFNKAAPINMRRHQLELLPGVGKKHMQEILEEREKKTFESFEDLRVRVKLMPNPENAIVRRIIMEMKEEDKHRIFVGH